jgi:hypothetical protein
MPPAKRARRTTPEPPPAPVAAEVLVAETLRDFLAALAKE